MPRGKKKSVEDHLAKKQAELDKAKEKVKTIEAELKALTEEKNIAMSMVLAGAAAEAGLSIEEAIARIKG